MRFLEQLALASLFVIFGACGERQPCASTDDKGPRVRLDLGLLTCNLPPVIAVGGSRRVGRNDVVTLDAKDTADPNGDTVRFAWTLVSKPTTSAALIEVANGRSVSFTADALGVFGVELVASDGELTAKETVSIVVENGAPVANAGDDVRVEVGGSALLDGTRSTDPDGDALSFQWTITRAPPSSQAALQGATTATPLLVPDVRGLYTLELEVSDGAASSSDEVVVASGVSINPPVARIASVSMPVALGSRVDLDGTQSSDPDGDPLTYAWSLLASPSGSSARVATASTAQTSLRVDVDGSYTVELVVSDGFFSSLPARLFISGGSGSGDGGVGPDPDASVSPDAGPPLPLELNLEYEMGPQNLSTVFGTSGNDVWIAGEDATMLRWDGVILRSMPSGAHASVDIFDAWFDSAAFGVAVGSNATILTWDGTQWSAQELDLVNGSQPELRGVFGFAPDDVWVVGGNSLASNVTLHWDGVAWTRVPNPGDGLSFPPVLRAVWGAAPDDVWVVGNDGLIWHWDGVAFTDMTLAGLSGHGFGRVHGSSAVDVWAVSGGDAYHWDGVAWTVVNLPATAGTNSAVYAFAPNDVWLAAGSLLHFDGTTWTEVLDPAAQVGAIWAESPTNVWVVGGSGAIYQWDGATWLRRAHSNFGYVSAVSAIADDDVMWAADAALYHWNGTDVRQLSYDSDLRRILDLWRAPSGELWGLAGNPPTRIVRWTGTDWAVEHAGRTMLGLSGSSPTDVWAVGEDGYAVHYDGASWTVVPTGVRSLLTSVSVTSPTNAWAVADDGTILRWDGRAWSRTRNADSIDLAAIYAPNDTTAWAVGNNIDGVILRWNGTTWVTDRTTMGRLAAIDGTGPNDIWTGVARELLHWDGASWTSVPLLVSDITPPEAFSCVAPGQVWMQHGRVARLYEGLWAYPFSTNGGTAGRVFVSAAGTAWATGHSVLRRIEGHWAQIINAPFSPRAIWGGAEDDVWFVGHNGQIAHYDGAGISAIPSGTTGSLWDVHGSGPSNVWAVGLDGVALHYDGSAWSSASGFNAGTSDLLAVRALTGGTTVIGGQGYLSTGSGGNWSVDPESFDFFAQDSDSIGPDVWLLDTDEILSGPRTPWTKNQIPRSQAVRFGMWVESRSRIMLVGQSGTIDLFDGTAWRSRFGGPDLHDAAGVPGVGAWVVGDEGPILRVR